jgi:hypothetical protein
MMPESHGENTSDHQGYTNGHSKKVFRKKMKRINE